MLKSVREMKLATVARAESDERKKTKHVETVGV